MRHIPREITLDENKKHPFENTKTITQSYNGGAKILK